MDIGQENKGKPLQRCLSFLPCSSKISGAVSVMQIRVFFPVSPGRFLCSAFDHVFRSAASARHGPHGSSQSPAAVFARQVIQLSNFKSLHIPPSDKAFMKSLSLNYSLIFEEIRISQDSCKMDIGQADKAKPLLRCLSFPPFSPKISGAVSFMQNRVFFPVSPGRFLCSAFDHVFRSAVSARHGPHGSSQSPAAVFARQVIQLSNSKSLHIPPSLRNPSTISDFGAKLCGCINQKKEIIL